MLFELRTSFAELQPELDDYVFVPEVEQWVSAFERERRRIDPKTPPSDQALMRMVWRVCVRAGVRRLSPHQLRHGFANRFLRESGRDFVALQALMGHSRPDTTQQYTDEVELDELAAALERAAANRMSQASPDPTTLEAELTDELETPRWRRRESNPRNISIGQQHLAKLPYTKRRCSECVRGRLPFAKALRDELSSLLFAPTVQHLQVRRVSPKVDAGGPGIQGRIAI